MLAAENRLLYKKKASRAINVTLKMEQHDVARLSREQLKKLNVKAQSSFA
jgi:hypothetical protein